MTHIGIERLDSRDRQGDRAKQHERQQRMAHHELRRIERVDRRQHLRIANDCSHTKCRNRSKPEHHDGAKDMPDLARAKPLGQKQDRQNRQCNVVLEARDTRHHHREPFDRRQHRNARRQNPISRKQRDREHADRNHNDAMPLLHVPQCKYAQRKRAALPLIVGPHDHQDVLDRDHQHQRPDEQREETEHLVPICTEAKDIVEGSLKRVQRTRADIAVDDADGAECEQYELALRDVTPWCGRTLMRGFHSQQSVSSGRRSLAAREDNPQDPRAGR